ncbi:MAG: MMPL family transporter [Gammaproteobacteria bacterium]
MGITSKLSTLVSRHTGLTLALVLVLAAVALSAIIDPRSGEVRLNIDPSANRLLSKDQPAKQFYDQTRRVFGNDETLIITLTSADIFTAETLDIIGQLTKRIESIAAVHHVVSLSNVVDIRSVEEDIDISPFVSGLEDGSISLEEIRSRVLANPVYAGNLVSTDSQATALVVYFNDISDSEYISGGTHDEILKVIEEERGDHEIFMTGTPYLKVAMIGMLVKDLTWIPPIITLVLAVILALSFRTVLGVIVPLVTVGVGVVFTLGTITALGYSLSMISILVPPLLMILGLSYSVHVVSEYHQLRRQNASSSEVVIETLGHMTLPVLLTGLTTIAGFIALIANPIEAVKEFGIFSAIGVVYISILSVTLTPALMKVLDFTPGKWKSGASTGSNKGFDRFVEKMAIFDLEHRRLIFTASAIIFLLALAGMTRIHVSTESITNFSSESGVRKGFEFVNEKLGGANPFYIVMEGSHTNAFKEPRNLRVLQDLQSWLEEQPEIGGTVSIVDYLKLVNQAFHENDPAFHAIPESRRLTTQLLFLSSTDDLERIVDSRYKTTNIVVSSKVVDSDKMSLLIGRIRDHLEELPGQFTATVTGNPVLISETLSDIIIGQARSIGLALVIVYGILSIMFMSQRVGFIALIPNVLPVAIYFGSLGFFGISLNPSTSLIAPMVLGIAIDDTIHYFSRFSSEIKHYADEKKTTLVTLKAVGRPVTYTSIGLCLGFLVLMTSDLRMQAQVGIMASYALAVAWLSDFILTPALSASFRITTLWDVLTVDLGKSPQESIPLLKGLRPSQAKIVAIMGKMINVPMGTRIINDGDSASEMYVVIEGSLSTTIEGEHGQVKVATHERGDVVGEAGLFFAKRTANVDASEDCRLLVLTQDNLDRLSRRYPFIATKVFRNLNSILAGRLSATTHRLT